MLQIEYNVEHVTEDEVVMEGEIVEDDNGPTKQTKEFQQPSKEVDTDESSEERDSDYDDQFDDLLDSEDVIFDRRGKKIIFRNNDNNSDYMPDDFDNDSDDNEYEVVLTVNGRMHMRLLHQSVLCDTQEAAAGAEV